MSEDNNLFGLPNINGSCWINTGLQAVFRIPEVQQRYDSETFEKENDLDDCLKTIWTSKGKEGFHELFEQIRTPTMPAGRGIGDTHELLQLFCDKLKYLDTLVRFKVADSIKCSNCDFKEIKEDTVTEFTISSEEKSRPISDCIAESVTPNTIEDWKCEKCSKSGCTKQQLIGSFPQVMMFHMIPTEGSVNYSSILSLNKHQYALISVTCFNGGHWWGYGRNMPPGSSWFTLNDRQVQEHGPKQFPISNKMRILIYYRLEN